MILPEGVQRVLAPNPSLMTGPGTNTYVIADRAGRAGSCVVVDPGPDDPSHLAAIVRAAAPHGGVSAILVTHGHPDHAAGAATLRAMTGAPVLAWSREGVPATDRPLTDNEALDVGGRTVRALHTPGHRFDHLCFLLEDAGVVFGGDLIAGTGTVVIAPPEGDLVDYLASLKRLLALPDLRVILPGHGPAVEDPYLRLREYVFHRELREQQVLEQLRAGRTQIPDMVAQIYADVDPRLHPVAARSTAAHLLKLEREGRVRRPSGAPDDGPWALVTEP